MKYCPQCGAALDDAVAVCNQCGFNFAQPMPGQPMPGQPMMGQPMVAPATANYDHTAEFTPQEISEGKVFGLSIYLLGLMGIIIALLACRDNRYVAFHIRTFLKIEIVTVLSVILCIIPILGWIACGIIVCIMTVLQIICFFNVCSGKAIDPAIIRGLGFLK